MANTSETRAPFTLRIPISLIRRWQANIDMANMPIQQITMAHPAKSEKVRLN